MIFMIAAKKVKPTAQPLVVWSHRPAADARTGEDEHIVQILDPLDSVQLCRGEPQEVQQMPLALWNVFVFHRLPDSMTPTR